MGLELQQSEYSRLGVKEPGNGMGVGPEKVRVPGKGTVVVVPEKGWGRVMGQRDGRRQGWGKTGKVFSNCGFAKKG